MLGSTIGSLFGFASRATAAEPVPTTPAPVTAAAPPAPVQTAQAEPANEPGTDAESPSEMTFGHGRTATPTPAPTTTAPSPASPPEGAPVRQRPRTMEEVAGASIQELTFKSVRWRYSLNFFGDVSLSGGKPSEGEHAFGFGLGGQDILIRGELSENIVTTTEMAFEAGEDGGIGVDLERFNVRWQSSRYFVEAGRTHTSFGYWNNAYHHGRWLQPTIERPRWVAFEDDGGILPVHWVGAGAGLRAPVGDATVNLSGTVGNGRGQIVDDVRNNHDFQNAKSFHGSFEVVGIGRPELRIGVAGIYGKIPGQSMMFRTQLPDNQTMTEIIGSAHIAYVNVPLLFIAEGYDVAHLALGHQWTTYGGFILLGYAIGRVTPYVEVERIANKGGPDPFFLPNPMAMDLPTFDSLEGIVGMRFDLTDWTALKIEYRQTKQWDLHLTQYDGVLNWSWGF
jgi:hypothetical protein